MQIQRCPECGIRLKTNYCDVCMKRVPFKGVPEKRTFQHHEGSSAHRTERGHECVSFDTPEKKKKTFTPKSGNAQTAKKTVKLSAIILAVLTLIPTLFGIVEDFTTSEPDISYEEFIQAGESGAENVPNIAPTVLYTDGEVTVSADYAGLYFDDYTIFLTIDNKSDRDLIINTASVSVNGYMLESGLYQEVRAGNTDQAFLQLYTYELNKADIDEVAWVEFRLDLFDADSYEDYAITDLITLKTDAMATYEAPIPPSGWEVYRDEKIAIDLISTGVYYGDCELQLYIENLSGQEVSVYAPTTLVNGQEATGSLWCSLRPDTRAVSTVYLYSVYDEDGEGITGLDQIDEINMDLHIEFMEDWNVEETINETITIKPNELSPTFE